MARPSLALIQNRQTRPGGGQRASDVQSHAARCAGDHGDFVFEGKICRKLIHCAFLVIFGCNHVDDLSPPLMVAAMFQHLHL
jgi:hypothetical protein